MEREHLSCVCFKQNVVDILYIYMAKTAPERQNVRVYQLLCCQAGVVQSGVRCARGYASCSVSLCKCCWPWILWGGTIRLLLPRPTSLCSTCSARVLDLVKWSCPSSRCAVRCQCLFAYLLCTGKQKKMEVEFFNIFMFMLEACLYS